MFLLFFKLLYQRFLQFMPFLKKITDLAIFFVCFFDIFSLLIHFSLLFNEFPNNIVKPFFIKSFNIFIQTNTDCLIHIVLCKYVLPVIKFYLFSIWLLLFFLIPLLTINLLIIKNGKFTCHF